jgi:hypothetical protein
MKEGFRVLSFWEESIFSKNGWFLESDKIEILLFFAFPSFLSIVLFPEHAMYLCFVNYIIAITTEALKGVVPGWWGGASIFNLIIINIINLCNILATT